LPIPPRPPEDPPQVAAGNPLRDLCDALDRLNASGGGMQERVEVEALLNQARGALDRVNTVAHALAQCDRCAEEGRLTNAVEALDAGLLLCPDDPALTRRRGEITVMLVLEETDWLVEHGRIDLAAAALRRQAVATPEQTAVTERLSEVEVLFAQWEQQRLVQDALTEADVLAEKQQWGAALAVLDAALSGLPDASALRETRDRIEAGRNTAEQAERLSRRIDAATRRIEAGSWSDALAILEGAQKEFPEEAELETLVRRVNERQRRSNLDTIAADVRQHLADKDYELARRTLKNGVATLGRTPELEKLAQEIQAECDYADGIGKAQMHFGRKELTDAEDILIRLTVHDRPDAQTLLAEVRQARARADQESFFRKEREHARELMADQRYREAADLLRHLLTLFPHDAILERDLKTASEAHERAIESAKPQALKQEPPLPQEPSKEQASAAAALSVTPAEPQVAGAPALPAAAAAPMPVAATERRPVAAAYPPHVATTEPRPAAGVHPAKVVAPEPPPIPDVLILGAPPQAPARLLSARNTAILSIAGVSLAAAAAGAWMYEGSNRATPYAQARARAMMASSNSEAASEVPLEPLPASPPLALKLPVVQQNHLPAASTPATPFRAPAPDPDSDFEAPRNKPAPKPFVAPLSHTPAASAGTISLPLVPDAPAVAPSQNATVLPPEVAKYVSLPATPGGGRAPAAPAKERTIVPPQLIRKVNPIFPAAARASGSSTTVVLSCTIDVNGRVKGIRLVSGNAGFAFEAQSAVRQWQYKPATLDGRPIESSVEIHLEFRR
jgi:protein TonB